MAESGAARWRTRLGSVRVRITLAAVAVVLVAATVGSLALVAALGSSLTDEVVGLAEDRADTIVATLEDGASPADAATADEEDRLVHIVTADGQVLARSPRAPDEPLASPEDGPVTDVAAPSDDEEYVVVARSAETGTGDGPLRVLVAQESSDIAEAQSALAGTLRVAVPLLTLVVGLLAWWLVGRALAPVDAIRREVDRIGADALDRRVPQPTTRDEVADLAATMNAMLDRLQQAQERQRRFVSDASHELRSPASAIRQHAEVGLAHPDSTTVDELARVVLSEGHRIEQLVGHLLLLARSDEGRLTEGGRPVDLDDLVLEEAARVRADARARLDVSSVSAGRVRGDALLLHRMVGNLVDNAARHARTTVKVGLTEVPGPNGGREVRLVVDDDGPGIAPADRGRVLERFVRLDDARARDAGGAGLGLSIVQAVARAHGGRVEVSASPDGGARLEVLLPADPTG